MSGKCFTSKSYSQSTRNHSWLNKNILRKQSKLLIRRFGGVEGTLPCSDFRTLQSISEATIDLEAVLSLVNT